MSTTSDLVSLRNFVVDEDRANLGADLLKPLDKNAFVLAQRDAIEAYNLARAIRLSEETAAQEHRVRVAQAEQAARSLARSWNVDGTLLKNSSLPRSSSSSNHPSSSSSSSSRPTLKREPPTADSLSSSPSSSKLSSASAAAAADSSSSSSPSGPSQQKRRKASSGSQPQYSYSTSNYSYHYPSHNHPNSQSTSSPSSHASVHAHQHAEGRKHSSSASSSSSVSLKDIQAGQILNPKESSPRTQSPSSSASAQAAAAEREKEKEKEREREREKEKEKQRSRSNSASTSRKRSSSSAAHHQPQVQSYQPQVQTPQQHQAPRDIFTSVRLNCTKCGNPISSLILSQPSSALTAPDPFSHPFASALHLICNNPACGAVHCRGCLQAIKCRDVDHPDYSQALVPFSSSASPPTSNPTSPVRPTFTSSKSQQHTQTQNQRACAGGPGCALWSCCPNVRVIAIWEALRAFDALFGAEAGFQTGGQSQQAKTGQGAELGRPYREAYVRMVISKSDKNMKKFEDGFVRVLKVVGSWCKIPTDAAQSSRRQSTIDEPDQQRRASTDDDDDQKTQSPNTFLLLHFARLFLSSHLLEVMHTFLSNRNVKDWMTHAETYLDVLEVVKKIMDCGLGFLLKEVSGTGVGSTSIAVSSSSATTSSGFYNPFAVVSPSSTSSSPSQSPPLVPLTVSSTLTPTGPTVTLYELVSQLESYKGELKKFLAKVSFGVTVDKATKLHEAITYLVLQLVVGEF